MPRGMAQRVAGRALRRARAVASRTSSATPAATNGPFGKDLRARVSNRRIPRTMMRGSARRASPRFVEVAADRIDVDVGCSWRGRDIESLVVPSRGEELDLPAAWGAGRESALGGQVWAGLARAPVDGEGWPVAVEDQAAVGGPFASDLPGDDRPPVRKDRARPLQAEEVRLRLTRSWTTAVWPPRRSMYSAHAEVPSTGKPRSCRAFFDAPKRTRTSTSHTAHKALNLMSRRVAMSHLSVDPVPIAIFGSIGGPGPRRKSRDASHSASHGSGYQFGFAGRAGRGTDDHQGSRPSGGPIGTRSETAARRATAVERVSGDGARLIPFFARTFADAVDDLVVGRHRRRRCVRHAGVDLDVVPAPSQTVAVTSVMARGRASEPS